MPAVVYLPKSLLSKRSREATSSATPKKSLAQRLTFFLHEPFFQFLALGLLAWLAIQYWSTHNGRYTIELSPPSASVSPPPTSSSSASAPVPQSCVA